MNTKSSTDYAAAVDRIRVLGGIVLPAGVQYPRASRSSAHSYAEIRRLRERMRDIEAQRTDWAIAALQPDGWMICADKLTKSRAELYASTLVACDVEAIVVRQFQ
jgi:hypothetical protein